MYQLHQLLPCMQTLTHVYTPLTLTHALSSLLLSMLSGTKQFWEDQSKAPSLLSEANTVTTIYVFFAPLSPQ